MGTLPLHFLWRSSIVPGFFKPSENLLDDCSDSEESGFSKFGSKPEVGGGGEGGGGTEAASTFPIFLDFMPKNFNNFAFFSVQYSNVSFGINSHAKTLNIYYIYTKIVNEKSAD